MAVKVLMVDDSEFSRCRVSEILSTDGQTRMVGTATNGREVIEQALALRPDVITMDYEMLLMDGITAIRSTMQRCPTLILTFSSLTHEGARVTLDALDVGAIDYLSGNFGDISCNPDKIRQLLHEKVLTIACGNHCSISLPPLPSAIPPSHAPASSSSSGVNTRASAGASPTSTSTSAAPKRKAHRLVVIGTPTGGPAALQRVLIQLLINFPAPLVLIQYTLAVFTKAFAERLDKLCRISVKRTEDGDILRPSLAPLISNGKQMMVDGRGMMHALPGDGHLNYKPCVDAIFGSAVKAYDNKVLAVILTGMGADGREGARLLKQGGNQVWAQDKANCVIYGMSMAVVKVNLADAVYGLDDIGRHPAKTYQ